MKPVAMSSAADTVAALRRLQGFMLEWRGRPPIIITHLSLTDFRNYSSLELSLPRGGVVLVGSNAQGKSNLLEAAYLLSIMRSHRAGVERELIRLGAEGERPWARVVGRAQGEAGGAEIEVVLQRTAGEAVSKRIKVNGVPRRAGEAVGVLAGVMFSADDIGLVSGPPALRRRYLDITSCQLSAHYLGSLQRYQRVLVQRNGLLKMAAQGRAGADEMEFWNREMVAEGGYIREHRQALVQALNGLAHQIHTGLTHGEEALQMDYRPNPLDPSPEAFAKALAEGRGRDMALGMTLSGPHRDDLRFMVNGMDIGIYGSRGQQRTVALSLRLAEAAFLHEGRGQPPVLLLDDVLSELDGHRRHQLLASLAPYDQWLLTTTDSSQVDSPYLEESTVRHIKGGTVGQPPGGL
ncbi:MAG: DNA replication/repair protein RecF [Dehalococcoidia bacterium]|nr:DNA replication/repair protein RecF [Dehalococcoidia bacterium]